MGLIILSILCGIWCACMVPVYYCSFGAWLPEGWTSGKKLFLSILSTTTLGIICSLWLTWWIVLSVMVIVLWLIYICLTRTTPERIGCPDDDF